MEPADPGLVIRESAPYGQACVSCSKAKCKCITRGPGNTCERCHRLRRDCQPSAPVRKRAVRRQAPRTTQLENKLNDLVTLLRTQASAKSHDAQQSPSRGSTETRGSPGSDHALRHNEPGADTWSHPVSTHHSLPSDKAHSNSAITTPSECNSAGSSTRPNPEPAKPWSNPTHIPAQSRSEAEECLHMFRDVHLHAFPFMHISPEESATQLQLERPFLWLNIRAICCKSVSEQSVLDTAVRSTLAQKMLVDLDRNMDLLQGVLVLLAWGMDKDRGKQRLCLYSNLAITLVSDLRLDRLVQDTVCKESAPHNAFRYPFRQLVPLERTKEEQRAVLACAFLCSSVSRFIKIPAMRWTSYMDDCLQHLTDSPEFQSDKCLAAMVRLSKLDDDFAAAFPWRSLEFAAPECFTVPPMLILRSLRKSLDETKRAIHPEAFKSRHVLSFWYATEAAITSLPLYSNTPSNGATGHTDLERVECFHDHIQASKKCVDNWFGFTPLELFGMPMPQYHHFVRCTHVWYRLALTDDPAWDRATIPRSVNLLGVMQRAAEQVSSVPAAVGLDSLGDDVFARTAASMMGTIPIWRRALDQIGAACAGQPAAEMVAGPSSLATTAPTDFDDAVPIDFLDDAWMTDMFNSWDMF